MSRLLIVEDDHKIADLLSKFLTGEGFETSIVTDGANAVAAIHETQPEVVLLDLMLPNKDGMEICRDARKTYQGIIIMMTASDDEFNELMALQVGVDDYVTKPVRLPILLARIKAVTRRVCVEQVNEKQVQDLLLNRSKRTITREGKNLDITDAEFELLWLLSEHEGDVVTRDFLFEQLLGKEYDGIDRAIDMRVSNLRKKLGDDSDPPKYIRSLRGRGYILL